MLPSPRTLPARAALAVSTAIACAPQAEPVFPADYAATYVEVRPCVKSGDHALNFVRILADPLARPVYEKRRDDGVKDPYPAGAVLLKEEFADEPCSDLVQWTAMKKAPAGEAADALGWAWQEVTPDRTVSDKPVLSCVGCHTSCPDVHDGSCALPPGN